MRGLRDKRALITGGSRGIGAAAAELFAEQGVHVAVGYRNRQRDAEALVSSLREKYKISAVAHASDISTRRFGVESIDEVMRFQRRFEKNPIRRLARRQGRLYRQGRRRHARQGLRP